MKDIHEVLRHKQAKYAQLGKQIELLQQVAEKLREVAPLLAETDDDSTVLAEVDDNSDTMSAKAGAGNAPQASSKASRPSAPRWP